MNAFLEQRPWLGTEAPPEVTAIPTMLSHQELALLYTLTRDYASGNGAIVDAGCFLGGSSAALLAGLRDRPLPWTGGPLYSYDLFRVEEYTLPRFFADRPSLSVGDSFRHLYDENVAVFDAPHVIREGDISEIGWSGEPIEILFIDVIKSWEINDAVMRCFLPHVIPGRTLIVHQDYGWGETPWLHITVELMRESLRWITAVPGCTHVFLVERPIPEEVLTLDTWRDIDSERKVQLIDQAIAHNDGDARSMVELSKAILLATLGRAQEGLELAEKVRRQSTGASVATCGQVVHDWLKTALRVS